MHVRHRTLSPLAVATAMAAPALAQVPDWTQLTPTPSPAARQNSAMAYDLSRSVGVLFGGWDGTQRRNDTWEWSGTAWVQVNTLNAPSPRDAIALAYDSVREVTVCTAGYVLPGETWEYDGVDWTQISPASTHALGAHCPMVYDTSRGVCVLFGQSGATNTLETWEWDGVTWSQITTASTPGDSGSMAYDSNRMRTVHFGGQGTTWEYDGSTWTQMSPASSPPGAGCGSDNLIYDPDRQRIVLFGGCPNPSTGDTWEYDGVDWQQITTVNVPSFPRRFPATTYDSVRQRTLLFGGRDLSTGSGVLVDDTWEYYAPSIMVEGCHGDGNDQMGCTDCTCGNNAPIGTAGGCLNSAGSSTRLLASGSSSISGASLRIEASGAPPNHSAILISAGAMGPANASSPCFGMDSGIQSVSLDGLRCVVQGVMRHGIRPVDINGDIGVTTAGWGTPDDFVQFSAFNSGATRHFQIIHVDSATSVCQTGRNTSQSVSVPFQP